MQGDSVLFLTPPLMPWNILPELGVPQILAYLRERGIVCHQRDWNVELLYDYLAIPPWRSRILEDSAQLSLPLEPELRQGRAGIPTWDIDTARLWVELCRKFLCPDATDYRLEALLAAVEQGHPVYEAFYENRLAQFSSTRPALVGLALLSSSQLLPGLILARYLRRKWPEAFLVAGGPWVSTATALQASFLQQVPWLDGLILHRAEEPLLRLYETIVQGQDPSQVPNLVWREGAGVRRTNSVPPPRLDSFPTPCFDDLPLHLYPVPRLPVQTTSRCGWGKCVFCHHDVRSLPADQREPEGVVDSLLRARERHGIPHFFLADCATPIAMMESLAGEILRRRENVTWSALARADAGYTPERCRKLRQGGCRALLLGLETASVSGLERLCKGITPPMVENAVRCCGDAGIGVYLFVLDYPGNTLEELKLTLEFVLALAPWLEDMIPSRFQLSEVTAVARSPELFSLRRTVEQGEWLDVFDVPFEAPGLIPIEQYQRLVSEYQRRFFERRGKPRRDPFLLGTLED